MPGKLGTRCVSDTLVCQYHVLYIFCYQCHSGSIARQSFVIFLYLMLVVIT